MKQSVKITRTMKRDMKKEMSDVILRALKDLGNEPKSTGPKQKREAQTISP